MSRGLRLTEKWMQRALWLVAFAFAWFLIGLGGKIVQNLNRAEAEITLAQFIDPAQAEAVQAAARQADEQRQAAADRLEQAKLKHDVAQSNTRAASETFNNWLATRQATDRPSQDAELVRRTAALDTLKEAERGALAAVQAEQQRLLDAEQAAEQVERRRAALEAPAFEAARQAEAMRELRVFLYRLALTLPLLLVAGWLYARKRHSRYWPFAWGFIIFALFAFFFELVPYLPSYGGYVRYAVGILVTVVVGRYAILSLQRYLDRQRAAEALPDAQRRQSLRYDKVMGQLGNGACPGCERPVDLKDASLDFCPHCGIGLFDRCGCCSVRKNAFARFCFSCGTTANAALAD